MDASDSDAALNRLKSSAAAFDELLGLLKRHLSHDPAAAAAIGEAAISFAGLMECEAITELTAANQRAIDRIFAEAKSK